MSNQLECRVSIINLKDGYIRLGMVDPVNGRYEDLGRHGPRDKDKAINDLKKAITKAGHKLVVTERSE